VGSPSARIRLALLVTAALTAGCLVPAPRHDNASGVGTVRAESPIAAQRYAEMLAELHPKVSAILPGSLDRDTELWVQTTLRRFAHEDHREDAMGFTVLARDLTPGRIHLRDNTAYPEWYLTHELVHALMGPTWGTLPGVLAEGLCDWIAAEVNPSYQPVIHTHRLLHSSMFFGGMSYEVDFTHPDTRRKTRSNIWYAYSGEPAELGPEEVIGLDRWSFHSKARVPVSYYGLGFVVVSRMMERITLEDLHEMCTDAENLGLTVIPTEWILAAAGIGESDDWARAGESLLGVDEVHEINRLLPVVFQELSIRAFADLYGDMDPLEFLHQVNPKLSLADGTHVPLSSIRGVRHALLDIWPSAPIGTWSAMR